MRELEKELLQEVKPAWGIGEATEFCALMLTIAITRSGGWHPDF